ncbi:MAG: hypothetical protein RMK29_14775 [Myxococcales bacterium]|nr:hypothetical protein [Myxococcales bacterium]
MEASKGFQAPAAGTAHRPSGTCRVRAWKLLFAAGLLHALLAAVLQALGWAGVAPTLVGPTGFSPVLAHDAAAFQFHASYLVWTLREQGLAAWVAVPAQLHAKLYSLSYAVLAPLCGYGTLGAEPLNILYYLATLVLLFQLGQQVGGPRAGLVAAAAVALWPSYLLLSVQILRDPLFIVALLLLCRCGVALVVGPRRAAGGLGLGLAGGLAVWVLWLVRWDFQEVVAGAALLAAVLAALGRQGAGRSGARLGAVLLVAMTLGAPRLAEATRPLGLFPRQSPGLAVAPLGPVVATHCDPATPLSCLHDLVERLAWRAGYLRQKFLHKYGRTGSAIDADVVLEGSGELVRYLPRALCIGLLAPFPHHWLEPGGRAGRAGRLLSAVEMLLLYAVYPLAVLALVQRPRAPAVYLGLVALAGCMALGAVVLNLGTLYRLRYAFCMLFVVLGSSAQLPVRLRLAGALSAACSRIRSAR